MEFALIHLMLFRGVCVGFGSPRTLFDTTVHNCKGDFRELRPTSAVGVPAIWESLRKAVLAKVRQLPFTESSAFWQAFEQAKKTCHASLQSTNTLRDKFAGARDIVGGQLRFILTGGGPIASDT